MKIVLLALCLLECFCGTVGFAAEKQVSSAIQDGAGSDEDRATRWQAALEDIQAAIDEDPDEAAKFLGGIAVQNLELEALEKLGEQARLFTQTKQIERLQQEQAERRRIRELQDLQRSRP